MSTTTEAIDLVDNLVKAKIPKETAKQLVGYADKQRNKSIDRLWIALIGGFSIIIAIMLYLHGDTKTEIQKSHENTKADIQKLENSIIENRKMLIQLIQKK